MINTILSEICTRNNYKYWFKNLILTTLILASCANNQKVLNSTVVSSQLKCRDVLDNPYYKSLLRKDSLALSGTRDLFFDVYFSNRYTACSIDSLQFTTLIDLLGRPATFRSGDNDTGSLGYYYNCFLDSTDEFERSCSWYTRFYFTRKDSFIFKYYRKQVDVMQSPRSKAVY